MEGEDFQLHWESEVKPNIEVSEEVICGIDNVQTATFSNMTTEELINNADNIAAENLMYLSQDVVTYTDTADIVADPSVECVTEEVITDDWVIPDGQERVEVPFDQLMHPRHDIKIENDIDVPLPTDQDEYTAMRPFPCDFCSRRFRKKAALMNHMVAHQNDRPHACNLCGVRYVRKCDLMNHFKVHAFIPEETEHIVPEYRSDEELQESPVTKPKKKRGRRKKKPEPNSVPDVNMTSARTQQWSRRGRTPPKPPSPLPSPSVSPSPPPSPPTPPSNSPPPPPADPSRPFVCRTCGVAFAREKALQSHSRIHGGDSPIECGECGELCWSRDSLASHAAHKHPHLSHLPRSAKQEPYDDNSGDDMDFRLSPLGHSGSEASVRHGLVYDSVRGPELFCQDCGVAFQRADLLRRHVAAAHSYKRHDSTSSTWEQEHTCEVCGESCPDALTLLAHAERHTERHTGARHKKLSKGHSASGSSGSRQFPCRECGKVFGSRSSQQIHVRIHTGERPYACRFCWKAFADGGTLRKHERIHTGEKPYACAVCPRAFNQRVVLREHVRSHHSAPDRRANGGYHYSCAVCGRPMLTSAELVQHLIQHCDENTALKRQPQAGPRKYKRRRKVKVEESPPSEWDAGSAPGSPAPRSPSPVPTPPPAPKRRRRAPPAPKPPRPRMIHTSEETRARTKQVRTRRPPRHPADDLRAICRSPLSPPSLSMPEEGPYKCEMCSLEFPRRDALLLHVPVHI